MVFLLSGDISPHRFDLRKTDGEYSVTVLPGEVIKLGAPGLDPQRGTAFELFDHRGRFHDARQGAQKMNMIFVPANDHGLAFELGQNSAKVSVQFFA